MSEMPLEDMPGLADVAHRAAEGGQVIYLTEHGHRLAAIVPADVATELAALGEDERAEVIEDLVASFAARRALESIEAGEPLADWEDVKARLDL
jgi:antitoxin (DNA-binding transcriptional repressor) of toxin-antitoxin stability system